MPPLLSLLVLLLLLLLVLLLLPLFPQLLALCCPGVAACAGARALQRRAQQLATAL